MLGTPLLVATCIYYKHTRSRTRRSGKQSGRNSEELQPTELVNTYKATDYHVTDDDGSCHFVLRKHRTCKRLRHLIDKLTKKKQTKSINMKDIPKTVKIPRSSEIWHSSLTCGERSSGSAQKRLLGSYGKGFHQVTRTAGSIPTDWPAFTSTKRLTKAESVYSAALTVSLEIGPVGLGEDEMDYLDAEGNDSNCCRNRYSMKRGFRYLFNQERSSDKYCNDDMEAERKRGFFTFQKFLNPTNSLGGGEGTSADSERRPLLRDGDGHAVIDKREQELMIIIEKEKREMSAPAPPKSVTFEDELSTITMQQHRGQSLAPPSSHLTDRIRRSAIPKTQQADFNYEISSNSGRNPRREIRSPMSRNDFSDGAHFSPVGSSREASLALDEATNDLLRLSSQPSSVWYSSSSRPLPVADRIPKSASTTSMNKIIRIKDGEVLKLPNKFSWETSINSNNRDPINRSADLDGEGRQHQTVTVCTNQRRRGPPVVRTTVQGTLKMQKIVGSQLRSIDHCMCSEWTIRDTTTHYKVKTTLGNRTLIIEESMNDKNHDKGFKMSLYEGGQLKTSDIADFQIPSNTDKAKYLSLLSERLLHDMETLNDPDGKTTTRVEVEVIQNVRKIIKTYMIGERDDLIQDLSVDQTAAVNGTQDSYEHKLLAPGREFAEKEYVDELKKDEITDRSSSEINCLFEGRHYEGHSDIRPHQRAESEATTTDSTVENYVSTPSIYNVECSLKRMQDHSCNEVNVAVPHMFSAVLSLIRERVSSQPPTHVSYGMEKQGKQYTGETTIRHTRHFESSESFDDLSNHRTNHKEPSFLFEKPQIIEPVKIPVLNIMELNLQRMADTSAILANFVIPRTDQSQLRIQSHYELNEAKGGSYGLQQKGQYFEGEMILKRKRRISLGSQTSSEEEAICGQTFLNLMKQESRGEFEVAIIISNDQCCSPKHFEASKPSEVINLIAQISTDGKKEEVVATLATRNSSKDAYLVRETSDVSSSAMITIQKTVNLHDIFQQTIQSWTAVHNVRAAAKFWAVVEEQIQAFFNLASSAIAWQEASCTRAMPNISRISYTGEFHSEDETVVIYMQNNLATATRMSCDDVRQASRFSGGHVLRTKASREETTIIMLSIGYDGGSKVLSVSALLPEHVKRKERMTIAEFGDAKEHVAILLQRAGVMHGQVQREWLEAVTGRWSTTTTIFTPTITSTSNTFESLTHSFSAVRNTDILCTDLTNVNTTTKNSHLSNFKTILPAHSAAQGIIPLIGTMTASVCLSINNTQHNPENSDEIRVKLANESCEIDEINEGQKSWQIISETSEFKVAEGVGEILDSHWVTYGHVPHEVEIKVESEHCGPSTDSSSDKQDLLLSMLTINQCMQGEQGGIELTDSHEEVSKIPSRITDAPIMRISKTQIEDTDGKCQSVEEFTKFTEKILTLDSRNLNRREEQFINREEGCNTEINDGLRSRENSSLPPLVYSDVNDNCKKSEICDKSISYSKVVSIKANEWQESTSLFSNTCEAPETWNKREGSHKQQFEDEEKRNGKHSDFCAEQKGVRLRLNTFPRIKKRKRKIRIRLQRYFDSENVPSDENEKEELKAKLRNSLSEARVAMLISEIDLDVTLLATPEMATQLTFEKDRSLTTSEYYFDEESCDITTEGISRSADDLLEENSRMINERSHFAGAIYDHGKHSKIIDPEKSNLQETCFLTTNLEASTFKESLVVEDDEKGRWDCDVVVEKFEHYAASSSVLSTFSPEQTRCDGSVGRIRVQAQVPSSIFHEIYEQTASTTRSAESIECISAKPVHGNHFTAFGAEAELQKQKVRHNISEMNSNQTTQQVFPTSSKVSTGVLVVTEEVSKTTVNSGRITQQAWSESAPASHNLVTTILTNDRVNYDEGNARYDAIVHFPPQPINKSLLGAIVVAKKPLSVTDDEIDASPKAPRNVLLQQQKGRVNGYEEVQQHNTTGIETVERQRTAISDSREMKPEGWVKSRQKLQSLRLIAKQRRECQFTEDEFSQEDIQEIAAVLLMQKETPINHRVTGHHSQVITNLATETFDVSPLHVTKAPLIEDISTESNTDLRYRSDEVGNAEKSVDVKIVREMFVNMNISGGDEKRIQMKHSVTETELVDNANFSDFKFSREYSGRLLLLKSEERTTNGDCNMETVRAGATECNEEAANSNHLLQRINAQEELTVQEYMNSSSNVGGSTKKQFIPEMIRNRFSEISIRNSRKEESYVRHPENEEEISIFLRRTSLKEQTRTENLTAEAHKYEVQTETTGLFAKLNRNEMVQNVGAQFDAPVEHDSHPNMQFPVSESTMLDEQLECYRKKKSDETTTVIQKPTAKESFEEGKDLVSAFNTHVERTSNVGRVFSDEIYETASARILEFNSEHQRFIAHWDMIQNSYESVEGYVAVAELEDAAHTAAAIKQENVQVIQQIEHPEFSKYTEKLISLKLNASATGERKIVEGSTEAIIQRSDEDIGRTAINIKSAHCESQTGIFQQHSLTSMETIVDLSRIPTKGMKHSETKISNNVARHWEECLNFKASMECVENLEKSFDKAASTEMVLRIMHDVNHEAVSVLLAASSEIYDTQTIMLDKQSSRCQSLEIILRDENREWIFSAQYPAQKKTSKMLDMAWSIIENDLDAAVNIREASREQAMLITGASKEVLLEGQATVCKKECSEYVSAHMPSMTAVSGNERHFKIESETKESILVHQQESFAETVQKAIFRTENLTQSVAECSEVHSNAGILLMRRSAKRTSEAASHVVGIVLTLSQQLKAQNAQENSKEANVELSIPASNVEVEDKIRSSVVTRDTVTLETKYAKTTAVQETVQLTKTRKVSADTASVLRASSTDVVNEKLKETDSKGFEILSQWTTVDRDLEAEVRLKHSYNIVSRFSTIAVTEEETSVDETWVAEECNSDACVIRCIVVSEYCKRCLQIEFAEMKTELRNSEKEGRCAACWCDKNYDKLHVCIRESMFEKLSAMVNLHKVSNVLPKQTAKECIWVEKQIFKAIPLYVKCSDIESDHVILDIRVEQKVAQENLEIIQISANWMEKETFECEQAGDEKFCMSVELQGKPSVSLRNGVIWPETRKGVDMTIDVDEYLEDQATIYAQFGSKQATVAESNKTIVISQNYEPQMLLTAATQEEFVNEYGEFRIVPEEKAISHVVIIGNRGEYLSIWMQEMKQSFVTIGFQYSEEDETYELEGNFVEKRFGGAYQLMAKSTQTEHRNANFEMFRRMQIESINQLSIENIKNFASMYLSASASEVTSLSTNWEKAPQIQEASVQRRCARKAESIRGRFLEISETMHTVHAQFRIKESSWKSPVIWKVANNGGRLTLNTECAEETVWDREIEYRRDEEFEDTVKVLKQAVTGIASVLSTQYTTVEVEEIRVDLVRPAFIGQAYLLLIQANKGVDIGVRLIEATDIRQSSYLQFAREVECVELEKMITEARFGGKFNLSTNASEEYELNALRELTSDIVRIAHCSHLVVSKSWNRGTCSKVLATKSESTDVQTSLRNLESTDEASYTVCQKPLLRDALMIQETEAVMLTVNLNYVKEKAKEISEITIRLKRFAKPCILRTSAAADEQKLMQWILEKQRDTMLATSARIPVKSIVKLPSFSTMQSESVEVAIFPNLQNCAAMLEVCKSLVAPNHGGNVNWTLHETCEENECSNYQFKQENLIEQAETVIPEPFCGGHSSLTIAATKESTIDVTLPLHSKLLSKAEIQFSARTSNESIPVVLSTRSAVSVESNEVVALESKPEIEDAKMIRKMANIERTQIVVTEIQLETENIIEKYQRKEEHAKIQKIIFVAFYGGHQQFETSAASTIVADIYKECVSKHLLFAEARLQRAVANISSPCEFSTHSSKLEECNREDRLQKRRSSENEVMLTLLVANYNFAKFCTRESTKEIITINTHWERDGTFEEARLYICDKRFGGSLHLSTQFAQESSVTFTAEMAASHSNLEKVLCTICAARQSSVQPILTTAFVTEVYTEINSQLNRPSVGQLSAMIVRTVHRIEALTAQLTESTAISETTDIQYQRPNEVLDAFSEVLPEARFGGSIILNALASKEALISIQSLHSPQCPKQLQVQIVMMEKNRASELCHLLASTERIVTTTVQLQKSSDLRRTEILKRALRTGDNRCCTFTEPTEINQFNNFSWKNPAESHARQVIILNEIRYGGNLEFFTKYASEDSIAITNTLQRTSAELTFTILKKTANQGESVRLGCSASEDNHTFVYLNLEAKKLSQLEISMSRKTANSEVPQKLVTKESSQLTLTSNVTMQKPSNYESVRSVCKAKNTGGIIELRCRASEKACIELNESLRKALGKPVETLLTLAEVCYGEHLTKHLIATEETIFNFDVSFEKQQMESKQSFTVKATNIGLPEILETMACRESITEIEKLEVRRSVTEMNVESVLKLARQCLPVSLQTDSAEETFIRHESEMHPDVQRISGAVEIEKSTSRVEREALTCTEALNVTLEHKGSEGEQEGKVEKRVSFAAEVTETTMSMDMSVTVEQRQTPLIVKKPMKKEQSGRRQILRQNEAPNFLPVRRNSLLLAMELGDAHNIPHYKTLEDVIKGIKKAGLEYSNLIFGIDYTKSNKYQGERTFDGRNLHSLCPNELNPYQQVIDIVGKTLSSFDADGVIPTYGFGDEESGGDGIFNLSNRNDMNAECNGFQEVLRIYNDITPSIRMSGPTNFVSLIEQAISIIREKHSYHILVIVADGQVTNEKINQKAIAAASRFPLSIIMVGVGDGPWNMMTRFDETLPKRMFDNFHFVDFHKVMFNAPNQEASFALNALMEIPDQYKAIKELGLLKHSRRG